MTARRRSPRSPRWLIRQREDEQSELIAALHDSVEPIRRDLADRLLRCQQAREARRGWRDLGGAGAHGYPYRCRSFACWDCGRSIVRRWEDDALGQFAGAENAECSAVTVVLARTAKVEMVRDIVVKARKDLGNLRAGMYRQPGGWRWRSVRASGIVGTDVATFDGPAPAARGQSTPLPLLPFVGSGGGEWWLPTAHLALHHPHLDRAELARSVMRRWPGAKRVDVRPFGEHQRAAENAADVVGYALEQSERVGIHGADFRWPPRWRADYHSWLFSLKRGLQPLGISLRPRREDHEPCPDDGGNLAAEAEWPRREIELMPVVI